MKSPRMISQLFPSSAAKCVLIATAAAALAGTQTASATLLAYEGFDYSVGSLDSQDGGTGWGAAWGSGFSVLSPGLTYPSLETVGNTASGNGQVFRDLAGSINSTSTTSGSIYLSFLLSQNSVNYGNISLFNSGTELLSFGDVYNGSGPATTYAMNRASGAPGPGGDFFPSVDAIDTTGTAQFLVMQLDYTTTPGSTIVYLYRNTSIGDIAPDTASAIASFTTTTQVDFNRIRLEDRDFSIDEIRIGTTYGDVTAVPEPTTTVLATIAISGLLFTTIRRRRISPA